MYTNYDEMPVYLTLKETAEALNVSQATARAFLNKGDIPFIKVGKQYRVAKEFLYLCWQEKST